jgi:protein O-GlcNAc transferase
MFAPMLDWLRKRLRTKDRLLPPSNFNDATIQTPDQNDQNAIGILHKTNGDVYFGQGNFAEAATRYRKAIVCNPDYAEALNNLGNASRELGLFDDAERCLRRAASIKPLPNVHYNLASLLLEKGRLSESIQEFDKEVARNANHYAALAIKVHQEQKLCLWDQLESDTRTLRQSIAEPHDIAESVFSPFAFIALPGTTRAEQKRCAEIWAQCEYRSLAKVRNQLRFNHKRPRGKKIAVGYLSGDFREHPLARLTAEMFELHDRGRFHVTAYSYGPDDGSAMRKRLVKAFDEFADIRGHSDIDAARKIYADKIDILVDLTGFTENTRSGILALRPAPLQLSHLGYLGTMGADFVDYLIADRFIVLPEHWDDYTEKILYLPNCFQPNDRTRPRHAAPARASCSLPGNSFVFCCFNQSYKITPDIFDVWCRLLTATRGSVLWLFASMPDVEVNLKREAKARGIDPGRLIIAPGVRPESYLARMQCADLFLDTSPYNGGATCSDALWMGLPVITCAGKTFSSRMAGSLLSALGMRELIVHDLDEYYQLARELAGDPGKLDAVRRKLNGNLDNTPLFDSTQFTRDLEAAYIRVMSKR